MKSKPKSRSISGMLEPRAVVDCGPASGETGRLDRIAVAAYYKAEARGFAPGGEVDDWLDAETEYDAAQER